MTTTDLIGLLILIGFTVPTVIYAFRIWIWPRITCDLDDRIMTTIALLLLVVVWTLEAIFH